MLGNRPPYTTMQQLNLDWVLSKLKTLLRLVPDDGAVGQILRRTRDGAVWSDEQGGGGGGAVQSVNGKTGAVVLDAADVGALPDDYMPPVTSVNGQTGAVAVPVPVQSVNGKTGAVVLDAADVGALPDDYTPPVTSVNGQTGVVVLDAAEVGALPDDYTPPVTSVNGQTGTVVLEASDVGAATPNESGTGYCKMPDGTLLEWGDVTIRVAANTRGTADVSFRNTFISVPYVLTAFDTVIITTAGAKPYESSAANITTTGFRMYMGNLGDTSNLKAFWIAIGRWK